MQFSRPQGSVWEYIKEAPYQRTRVPVVLCSDRQPLRKKSIRLEATRSERIKISGIKIDHTYGRWWGRLKSDQIVPFGAARQFSASIAQANLQPRIGARIEVSSENSPALYNGRQQFGTDSFLQLSKLQGCAGHDARAEPDYHGRARLSIVY